MDIQTVKIEKPEAINFILGQSHFIKTVEDIHEALVNSVPGIKFGLAFCEASGECLIRWTGTDEGMIELASLRPFEAAWRVFIVHEADRMGGPAQNHLLKTLEEPLGRSVFLLVTEHPQLLLPTIRSRCQRVRFGRLAPETTTSRSWSGTAACCGWRATPWDWFPCSIAPCPAASGSPPRSTRWWRWRHPAPIFLR